LAECSTAYTEYCVGHNVNGEIQLVMVHNIIFQCIRILVTRNWGLNMARILLLHTMFNPPKLIARFCFWFSVQ